VESHRGIQRLLTIPSIYSGFQKFVGGNAGDWLYREYWGIDRFRGKVIDIGCGPGKLLNFLPEEAEYAGFDISAPYVETARETWAGRPNTSFHVGAVADVCDLEPFRSADLFVMSGVMHHIDDDEVDTILDFIARRLNPGGRFIAIEPCYLVKQSWSHRKVLRQDRGKSIRTERQWKALLRRHFPVVETEISTGMLRIPYTHILIECRNEPEAGNAR
jgi:SAM-dependent methyltransferase